MKLEHAGEQLIKSFETLELEAYPDPASPLGVACRELGKLMRHYRQVPGWQQYDGSPWTIGWGHTGPEVRPGDTINEAQAQALFEQDVELYELGVTRLAGPFLNQNQFDACVSFAFNVGLDEDTDSTPEGFGDSTLLKYIKLHKYALASGEFLKWNKAGGVVMLGLVRRRRAEQKLFDTPFTQHIAP